MGSVYGFKLSARHDVTLVGTEAYVRAVQQRGLRVEGALTSATFPIKAVTHLDAIEPGTLIILNGAVAALGGDYGIECPVNRALTTIIKQLESQAR